MYTPSAWKLKNDCSSQGNRQHTNISVESSTLPETIHNAKKTLWEGIVLPEWVIALVTYDKVSLVVVAFYFLKIFILQKCCRFLEPGWKGFLTSTAQTLSCVSTYLSISAREKNGIFFSEVPHTVVGKLTFIFPWLWETVLVLQESGTVSLPLFACSFAIFFRVY